MKKWTATVAGAALMASTALALADEAVGTLATVDDATGTITLDTGETFTLGEGVSADGIDQGAPVVVEYQVDDQGNKVVTSIEQAG